MSVGTTCPTLLEASTFVMRLHDARHTHLTHLLRSGEPIQNVSARAGHGSSSTTLTTYAHVIAGDDERTAARAAGLFGD